MADKRDLSDRELFRLGADNIRAAQRAESFDMPDAAKHWTREYKAVEDEFKRRDQERHG